MWSRTIWPQAKPQLCFNCLSAVQQPYSWPRLAVRVLRRCNNVRDMRRARSETDLCLCTGRGFDDGMQPLGAVEIEEIVCGRCTCLPLVQNRPAQQTTSQWTGTGATTTVIERRNSKQRRQQCRATSAATPSLRFARRRSSGANVAMMRPPPPRPQTHLAIAWALQARVNALVHKPVRDRENLHYTLDEHCFPFGVSREPLRSGGCLR